MRPFGRLASAGLALGLLAACATSEPSRFYTLAGAAPPSAEAGTGPTLGLGPIAFPDYLDRPEITTRQGEHQIRIGEVDKWAEPLEGMFARELAGRLREAAGAREVVLLPASRSVELPYAVEVDISRFDAAETGEVVLDASWRVLAGEGGRLVRESRALIREPGAPAPDYPGIVAAMNRAVAGLAREIAVTVPQPRRRGA